MDNSVTRDVLPDKLVTLKHYYDVRFLWAPSDIAETALKPFGNALRQSCNTVGLLRNATGR